jgi:hypothetical protein
MLACWMEIPFGRGKKAIGSSNRAGRFFVGTSGHPPPTRHWVPFQAIPRREVEDQSKNLKKQSVRNSGDYLRVVIEHSDNRLNVVSVKRTLRDTLSRQFVGGSGARHASREAALSLPMRSRVTDSTM